ncbi:hypothetical protein HOG17_03505 [Candidatus Peregrinibacteria bacterium]|jgi:hypothetical protein|nr:hypothetical protein [Candidatus Peregrinibacteria bacterium]MBT4148271.1 hypothetical protein [Candidatus Peregrinibacteria bacterium]MBT4366557.1 hypothetical protein [Candidatus Peregrinibacteria bacterium]
MEDAFFRQIRRNLEALMVEGRLAEAYSKGKEILQKYPDQKPIRDLMADISKRMMTMNKQQIKDGVKEAKSLNKAGDLVGALRKLKELITLSPQDAKLKRLYLKIQKTYKEKIDKQSKNFLEQKSKEIHELYEAGDRTNLIIRLQELAREYKNNKQMITLIRSYREKIIEEEVTKKKELINSTKFEDIRGFIKDLKKIDETSKTIKNLENYISRRQMGNQVENIEEFVFASEDSLATLVKLKKFEEAIIVANEILKTNPDNKKVRKNLKKAKRKAFFKNQKEVARKIKLSLPKLKEEYKKNKSNFVRIH